MGRLGGWTNGAGGEWRVEAAAAEGAAGDLH